MGFIPPHFAQLRAIRPIPANTIECIRSASSVKPGRDKRSGGEFAREVPQFSCRNHKRSLGLGEDGMMQPLCRVHSSRSITGPLKIRNLASVAYIIPMGQKNKE
jgi:hypothetical protein